MSLSPDAIAAAVKAEIERQQQTVVYDELSTEELQRVVAQLTAKLDMCMSALASRGAASAKADEPKPAEALKGKSKFAPLPFEKPDGTQDADAIKDYLTKTMSERIMIMDGAMGTAIQAYKFTEKDFRTGHFEDHPGEIKGNNDLLVFTQVRSIAGRPHMKPRPHSVPPFFFSRATAARSRIRSARSTTSTTPPARTSARRTPSRARPSRRPTTRWSTSCTR